jgi:hypothetical protein
MFTMLSCKVTETNVVGTYTEKYGKKIILNADKTSQIEVEILDTVLHIFRYHKPIKGKWSLNKNMLTFNIADTNYKYLENCYYEVSRSLIRKPLIWNWGPARDKSNFNRYNKTK